ncbi:DNA polymerase theta [Eumeta japonica]|uniref:DNA-directed DNA polymerase n=1 Tax=Eumeta variegata TaxID=151549 RepID=A0A4C1ZYY6_EUMVA|nr:DNA polymerase theta [Eumeta japonica]
MNEPNLQSVPRTFSIPVGFLSISDTCEYPSDDVVEYNCRKVFKASPGHLLVSADYCQIEMRILTHFCEDDTLTKIMKSNMDVFSSIAASWGRVSVEEVDDELRQRAKQLCYGIIYGMGSKTLGQQLDVCEMEAAVIMDTFHSTYPAIKIFTQRVIDDCKKKGYVETLTKRRRYLPDINSKVVPRRCAAERQAVNTTIQGSAADIVKNAMCDIAKQLEDNTQCTAHLVLQMHDELIYEVSEASADIFIEILKKTMENTMLLNVPLPVEREAPLSTRDQYLPPRVLLFPLAPAALLRRERNNPPSLAPSAATFARPLSSSRT